MQKRFETFFPFAAWALLALPALALLADLAGGDRRALHHAVNESGQWAAWCLVIALSITPVAMLFKGWSFTRWLRKSRRWFGVAAFGYGALHLAAYLMGEQALSRVMAQATRPDMLFGWLAFAVFLPLAATSTDRAVKMLGRRWKTLQRWVYVAAAGVLLHWALLHRGHGLVDALVTFSPWFALSAYRVWYRHLRPRTRALTA